MTAANTLPWRDTLIAIIGATMIAIGAWRLAAAAGAVEIERVSHGGSPVTLFRPAGNTGPAPVVLISHGFAGSQQLMQSFALTLARNGYLAITFDYFGHGRHPEALRGDVTKIEGATRMLVEQTRDIADYASGLPGATGELALLGHSMASDIIVRYALTDPRVRATVAVSMFSTAVTADAPANLLVIVGGWEGYLKAEALRVQGMVTHSPAEAVTVGDVTDGSARRVVFADGVEHVGVLYSTQAQREALQWLDQVFERVGAGGVARRGPAIVLLLAGLIVLAWPLSRCLPRVVSQPVGASLAWRQLLPAGLLPALVTPLLLKPLPADFLGVLVGGYLAGHFLVYGLVSALVLAWINRARQRPRTRVYYAKLLVACTLATLYFAGVFALALDTHVTSYAITATRLPLVLATLVGTLVYFLADEWLVHGEVTARGGHLFTRVCFLLSLGLAVALSFEDLFFLLIISAVIAVYFLVYGLFSRWVYQSTWHPAVGAIANAVSFAWALGAVFPFLAA